MNISSELWDRKISRDIYLFTMANERVEVQLSNYGCTVTAIHVKGNDGEKKNIILGYRDLQDYLTDKFYMGCIVGRFAGRISGAAFVIDNKTYRLTDNENGNHLHGGAYGFNKKTFSVLDSGCNDLFCYVRFGTTSQHLEEGYPGELELAVTISLSSGNEITISYEARTSSATHLNLTHHLYYNLAANKLSGWEQQLALHASRYLGQRSDFIPDGTLKPVQYSTFDFTNLRPIKSAASNKGFNDYFVLDGKGELKPDAVLRHPASGLTMELTTTYPCIVLYSGDYLSHPFTASEGVCLETQFFPDSPNQPHLPSTVLMPGNIYFHETKILLKNIL